MDGRRQPSTVDEIDAEIARLSQRYFGQADVFDEELARIRVDELLERRQLLTGPDQGEAA